MTPLSPYDPEVEALWRAVDAAGARSVAVVSALPGEGTTLIAAALARRAGLSGSPALLVDLNEIRPGVGRLLGLRAQPGEIVSLPAMGLGVLAELAPKDAEQWREPAALAAQVERWAPEWGMVIFDTAPLLSRDFETIPAASIASAAQAAVMVVAAGRTPQSAIRDGRARLTSSNARLLGTVMNNRDNPSLLTELERESYRLAPMMPRLMAGLRARLRHATLLSVRA